MRLTEAPSTIAMTVEREAEFESLGFTLHRMPRMLVYLESEKFLPELESNPQVAAVITTAELAGRMPPERGLAVAASPRQAFFEFHNYLARHTSFYGSDFPTEIAPDARIHPRAYVAEKNVRIGPRVIVEPNATILGLSILEEDVIVRAGTVIGCEGFEFKQLGDKILPVAHAGGARLRARAEVQYNSTVDRSVFGGFTEVGEETKIDNMVHVGHNVRIGARSRVAAMTVLSGSATIGNGVWIGPGSTISTGVHIGDNAYVTLGSVVTRDVGPGQRVTGNFAIDHERFLAFIKTIR
jgi:UDP-3-O-[3-hydroxymyristoyl] glucosamine N-acyltransferase